MDKETVCKKVSSMLSLYLDNRVSVQEQIFIEEHLKTCPLCKKKYLYLKSLIKSLKDSYRQIVELSAKKQKQQRFSIREHQKFLENLSPYVDNELDAQECYEFRKYLMKSKNAQKELKNTYIIQKQLRNAYNLTKNKASVSISKNVMRTLRQENAGVFDSVILEQIFSMKTAKIAILAGFVLFGAYGVKNLDVPLKNQSKPAIEVIDSVSNEDSGTPASTLKRAAVKFLHISH